MPTSSPPQNPEPLIGPEFVCRCRPEPASGARIDMVGELDVATAPVARDALGRAQAVSPSVVCDLRDLSFIDASGVRVFLDAAVHARCTGGSLTFTHCSASLPRLLGVLGLEHALEIEAPSLLASGSRGPRDEGPLGVGAGRAAL